MAEDFSPRYECHGAHLVVVDVSGLERLFGEPRQIAEAMSRSAVDRGFRVHIAIAATRTAAKVLAMTRPGVTVIGRGEERQALAPIGIGILDTIDPKTQTEKRTKKAEDVLDVFARWGLKTLGDLAALPADDLAARMGQQGLTWQGVACGRDVGPLVPMLAAERFDASIDLEWPIDGLEPLSFVLTRLLEPLSTRLERQDRGAAALHVTLGLVESHDIQRDGEAGKAGGSLVQPLYTCTLQLPAPIRDVRTLRTLILLDLESHPPAAPIERVAIVIDPTPGRVLQHALFARARPTPEQVSTLIARLNALMGEDRIGRPEPVDSSRPGAFAMKPFAVDHPDRGRRGDEDRGRDLFSEGVVSALRRCRRPVPARVTMAGGRPAMVTTDRRGFAGGQVMACAGPWRSSGHWWAGRASGAGRAGGAGEPQQKSVPPVQPFPPIQPWDRDEWDVSLSDGAVYRIFQDRVTDGWFIDAIVD